MALTTVESGLSFVTYTGDGVITAYPFTFSYIDPSEIKVQVNGSNITYTTGVATSGQYSVTTGQVTLGAAGTDGDVVKIYRNTKRDSRYVDFSPGSNLTAATLDKSANQLFHIVQELIDGQLTATGFLPAPGGNGSSQTNQVDIDGDGMSGTDTGLDLDNALFQIFVNGIRAHPSDYSVDGSTLTFNYPLTANDVIILEFLTAGGSITAIDNGVVDTAQLAEDAITSAKIADGAVEWSHFKDAAFDGDWSTIDDTESPQGILEDLNTRLTLVEALNTLSSGDIKISEIIIHGSAQTITTFSNGQPDYVLWIDAENNNSGMVAQGTTNANQTLSGSTLTSASSGDNRPEYVIAFQEVD